jgi:hypothetical protein
VARKLGERVGDEEGIREGGTTKSSRGEGWRLDDDGGHRKEMRVGVEGKGNSAELRGKGEPSDGTIRQEKVAASAGGGVWREARVRDRKSWGRPESDRKVGDKGMERVGSGGSNSGSGKGGNRKGSRSKRGDGDGGDAFQRVRLGREDSRVIGGRSGSAVSEV